MYLGQNPNMISVQYLDLPYITLPVRYGTVPYVTVRYLTVLYRSGAIGAIGAIGSIGAINISIHYADIGLTARASSLAPRVLTKKSPHPYDRSTNKVNQEPHRDPTALLGAAILEHLGLRCSPATEECPTIFLFLQRMAKAGAEA